MNLSKVVLLSLGVLFFAGCGGGGSSDSSENRWTNKRAIAILRYVPSGICESEEYRSLLSEDYTGVITEEKPNNTSCEDYGRHNDGDRCAIVNYEGSPRGDVACVIGVDGSRNEQKMIDSSFADDIRVKFIQLAD